MRKRNLDKYPMICNKDKNGVMQRDKINKLTWTYPCRFVREDVDCDTAE